MLLLTVSIYYEIILCFLRLYDTALRIVTKSPIYGIKSEERKSEMYDEIDDDRLGSTTNSSSFVSDKYCLTDLVSMFY